MTTTTETARTKSRRIRRASVEIAAENAPRLRECLSSGQFVGFEAEKKDGSQVKYCGHKLFARHWTAKPAAELTAPKKARSEKQKGQTVFSAVYSGGAKIHDGVASIAADSIVYRITHNGKTWKLGKSEFDLQREEYAKERVAGLKSVVQSALAEALAEGNFPADFCNI